MNIYYVYEYLREDMTPYYVGKGKGNRWRQKHTVKVPPKERIRFVAINLSEEEALNLEEELIKKYGRKDLGTGILRNLTSGGESPVIGPEVRKKLSELKKGKKPNNYGKKRTTEYTLDEFFNRSRAKSGKNHPMYGKEHTEESKIKIREASKLMHMNMPIVECPHCGKLGKKGMAMTRWHFDNCKLFV